MIHRGRHGTGILSFLIPWRSVGFPLAPVLGYILLQPFRRPPGSKKDSYFSLIQHLLGILPGKKLLIQNSFLIPVCQNGKRLSRLLLHRSIAGPAILVQEPVLGICPKSGKNGLKSHTAFPDTRHVPIQPRAQNSDGILSAHVVLYKRPGCRSDLLHCIRHLQSQRIQPVLSDPHKIDTTGGKTGEGNRHHFPVFCHRLHSLTSHAVHIGFQLIRGHIPVNFCHRLQQIVFQHLAILLFFHQKGVRKHIAGDIQINIALKFIFGINPVIRHPDAQIPTDPVQEPVVFHGFSFRKTDRILQEHPQVNLPPLFFVLLTIFLRRQPDPHPCSRQNKEQRGGHPCFLHSFPASFFLYSPGLQHTFSLKTRLK